MPKTCAILLAAGESSRMGNPKPLLPWFGATLVERQAEALLDAGVDDVYVVTGHRAYEVQARVRGPHVHRVLNPHYKLGKSTSVKAGLAGLPEGAGAIVLLAVDQPRPAWLIRQVLESHRAKHALITCPRYKGHGGHPLVFDGSLAVELDTISEETHGVRSVIKAHADQVNWVDVDTPLARMDLNTPEAYEEAVRTFPDPRKR
jgi:molybdenum cofactor cytidylyltransferase